MDERNPKIMTEPNPSPAWDAMAAYRRVQALAGDRVIEPFDVYSEAWRLGPLTCFGSGAVEQPGLHTSKGTDNFLFCGYGSTSFGSLMVTGSRNVVFVGPYCDLSGCRLIFPGSDGILYVGAFSRALNGSFLQVFASGGRVMIGDGCHIGEGVIVSNSDTHGLYRASDGKRINHESDVIIGDGSFIGYESRVNKGVEIEPGAIILERSVVNGKVRGGCLYDGVPAVLRETGVAWSAQAAPGDSLAMAREKEARIMAERMAALRARADRQSAGVA